MEILERGPLLDELGRLLAGSRHGRGRVVLLEGEAGIGKTTLLDTFLTERARRVRVLRGACDPGSPPRPFAPFWDIVASGRGGADVRRALLTGRQEDVDRAALDLLRSGGRPTILALEDLHWADDGTLKLLRVIANRVRDMGVLVVGTRRADEPAADLALDRILADVPRGVVVRLEVPSLTQAAVRRLAAGRAVDAAALHRATGGNPFLVVEALAADAGWVPASVRDLVSSRARRMSEAGRDVLRAAAVLGVATARPVLGEVAGHPVAAVDEVVLTGLLVAAVDGVAFRHDLLRLAVLDEADAGSRRRLHARALRVLSAADPAATMQLARHAIGARDRKAIVELGSTAAAEAARLGAYRQAATLYATVLSARNALPTSLRADLLEAHAAAATRADDIASALRSQRAALRLRRRSRDRVAEGAARRRMAELWWLAGDGPRGLAEARAAVALLEAEPGGRDELAWALASLAQRLAVAAHPSEVVLEIGGRALALAEELGIEGAAVHALTTLGIIDAYDDAGSGSPDSTRLQESVERGRATGQTAAVTRSLINLAEAALHFRRLDEAERWTAEAMAWLEAESPGDLVFLRMLRLRQAEIDFERGQWDGAARVAEEILALVDEQGSSNQVRVRAVTILGRIGARRGHLDPWPLLDEGMSLVGPDEIQDLGPLFAARIEACLLADEPERATREARAALDMLARIIPIADYLGGEAWYWSWRAGAVQVLPPEVPNPFRLETVGRPLDAARAWEEIGSPYQRALALLAAGDEASLQVALDILLGLGARPMARRAAARLRAIGAPTIRRGPWRRTRGNPSGLTDRQVEILALLGRGASNQEIAASLVISPKTVDHHVSAVLRKLGVANRRAAGRVALELGIGLGGPAKDGESAARIAG